MAKLIFSKPRKRWMVDYTDQTGRHRIFFTSKENALDHHEQIQKREERVRHNLPFLQAIKFKEASTLFYQEYLSTKSKSYQKTERSRLHFISKTFGNYWLSDVTQADIDTFRLERSKEVSNKTIINYLTTLSSFFDWAVKRQPQLLYQNPAKGVLRPTKIPRTVRRSLEREEIGRLLENSCKCCFPGIFIAANTGIRKGELLALNKSDFNLMKHVLKLRHSEDSPLKSKRGRDIPLNDDLEAFVKTLPEGPIVPVGEWTLDRHFQAVRRKAEVKAVFHELRHTWITEVVNCGIFTLRECQLMAGHSSIRTTEGYLHGGGLDITNKRNAVSFTVPYECQTVRKTR